MDKVDNVIKAPIEEKQLQRLLNVKTLPEPLKDNVIYEGSNLDEFFIGYTREVIGNNKSSYKVITKSVVLKNKGINLPVRRNQREELSWNIDSWDRLPPKVVIALEVSEEFFMLEQKSSTTSLLIGVFKKEELQDYLAMSVVSNTGSGGELPC